MKLTDPHALVTQTCLAGILKVSRDTVRRLERENVIFREDHPGQHPLYKLSAAIPAYNNYRIGQLVDDDDDANLDPQAEKAKLDKERRKQLEIANAKTLGELRDSAEVRDVFAEALKVLVTALSTLPDRLERECQMDAKQVSLVESVVNATRESMVRRLGGDDESV